MRHGRSEQPTPELTSQADIQSKAVVDYSVSERRLLMPGPPPEHPHLRLLKGNSGKRPARKPPEPPRGDVCPELPKHLNA
jgi:hypothetical protein